MSQYARREYGAENSASLSRRVMSHHCHSRSWKAPHHAVARARNYCRWGLVFEVVVGTGALRGGAALEELRRVLTRLARLARRAFGRVAPDLGLELDDVDELVRLAAQFVSHHGWLRRDRRDDDNPHATPLHRLDQ